MTKDNLRKEWKSRIDAFAKSGQSQAAWCREHKLNLRQFRYWHKKFRTPDSTPMKWLSIKVDEPEETKLDGTLQIRIGQAAIEVKRGFDRELLLEAAKVLIELC